MVCRGTLLANGSAADTSYEWHVWCVKLRMRVPNALGGINLNASENVLDFGMMRLFSNFQLVYSQRVSHTKLKWCMISSSVRVVNQTVGRSSKLFCHSSHLKVFAKGTRIICKKNLVSICKKQQKHPETFKPELVCLQSFSAGYVFGWSRPRHEAMQVMHLHSLAALLLTGML